MMIFDRHWLTLIIDLHFSTMINMLGNASWNISSISSLAASRQALWRWSSSAAPRWKHSQNWSMRTMRHHGTIQDGGMLETGYQGELTHTHMLSHVVSFVGALWIGSQRYGNASRCGISVACRSFRYPRHQVCRLGDAFAVCFSLPGWADNVSVVSVRFCFLLQQVSFPSREIHSHGPCFFPQGRTASPLWELFHNLRSTRHCTMFTECDPSRVLLGQFLSRFFIWFAKWWAEITSATLGEF
jgi:hypothetical protein